MLFKHFGKETARMKWDKGHKIKTNGAQNKNQKTSKKWNTVHYSVSNKQKPSTIPSRKFNNCNWVLVVQHMPKYLKDIESIKTEKFKFKLNKFLELIPDEPKMSNNDTASGSNNILDQLIHLRAQGIYKVVESPTRPRSGHSCFETTPSIHASTSA